jgi:hypothetical protein
MEKTAEQLTNFGDNIDIDRKDNIDSMDNIDNDFRNK